jgi:hypothetical protein
MIFYVLECQQCVPIKPMRYGQEVIRDRLAKFHRDHYGHDVATWGEIG